MAVTNGRSASRLFCQYPGIERVKSCQYRASRVLADLHRSPGEAQLERIDLRAGDTYLYLPCNMAKINTYLVIWSKPEKIEIKSLERYKTTGRGNWLVALRGSEGRALFFKKFQRTVLKVVTFFSLVYTYLVIWSKRFHHQNTKMQSLEICYQELVYLSSQVT